MGYGPKGLVRPGVWRRSEGGFVVVVVPGIVVVDV